MGPYPGMVYNGHIRPASIGLIQALLSRRPLRPSRPLGLVGGWLCGLVGGDSINPVIIGTLGGLSGEEWRALDTINKASRFVASPKLLYQLPEKAREHKFWATFNEFFMVYFGV